MQRLNEHDCPEPALPNKVYAMVGDAKPNEKLTDRPVAAK